MNKQKKHDNSIILLFEISLILSEGITSPTFRRDKPYRPDPFSSRFD
jgi:hypothetical protein